MKPYLLFIPAILLEVISVWGLLGSPTHSSDILIALAIFHTVSMLLLSLGASMLIPKNYSDSRLTCILVLFIPIFFIPVIGLFGLLFAIVPALRNPVEALPEFVIRTPIPDLPFKPVEVDLEASFAGGGLYDALKHSPDTERRAKAVLATQRMKETKAIPILQIALKDPVDDVRLLAYSILDQKENTINVDIKQALTELETADEQQQLALHNGLAFLYWELVYLGMAQGDVLVHILNTAKKHIHKVLNKAQDAGLYLLLGRILLRQGEYEESEKALLEAVEQGIDLPSVTPYLAEIAYLMKDYQRIPVLLAELPLADKKRYPLSNVVNYWRAA